MSPKENLLRLIEQLPADKLAELERLVISMLPPSVPAPGPRMSFDEALAHTNKTLAKTLKRLAK